MGLGQRRLQGDALKLVTVDFETYFDKKYSLKSKDLSTSAYIGDPRFEVLCMAINISPSWDPVVVWGTDEIRKLLHAIDWSDAELLAHHAHFEGLILSHHFGVRPRVYRDTLSMSRLVYPHHMSHELKDLAARLEVPTQKLAMPDFKGKHLADIDTDMRSKVSGYVGADIGACHEAYHRLLPLVPEAEMELIDTTVRMFADPVLRLDEPRARAELARATAAKDAEVLASGVDKDVLMSNQKLAAKLRELGVEPPTKVSPTTHKMTLAMAQTDLNFTALKRHADPRVAALVKGRLAVKGTLDETRAARLVRAWERFASLPVYYNFAGAHTLRWSGGDKLNFQNFPRGGELRYSLLAPPGHVLVPVDLSQIEVRVLAWLSGEQWLLDEFAKPDGDPYCAFGTKAYGRRIVKGVDKDERQLSKVCVLALGFGMGAWKLQQTFAWGTHGPEIDLPMEQCEGFVNTYRWSSREVVRFWDRMTSAIGDMVKGRQGKWKALQWEKDKILLPNGTTLHYPDIGGQMHVVQKSSWFGGRVEEEVPADVTYLSRDGRSKVYGGLMTENVVQALARVIVAEHMRQLSKRWRVVMFSHDEVVMAAPEERAKECLADGLATMRVPPSWAPDIPLNAEGGFAVNYSK